MFFQIKKENEYEPNPHFIPHTNFFCSEKKKNPTNVTSFPFWFCVNAPCHTPVPRIVWTASASTGSHWRRPGRSCAAGGVQRGVGWLHRRATVLGQEDEQEVRRHGGARLVERGAGRMGEPTANLREGLQEARVAALRGREDIRQEHYRAPRRAAGRHRLFEQSEFNQSIPPALRPSHSWPGSR